MWAGSKNFNVAEDLHLAKNSIFEELGERPLALNAFHMRSAALSQYANDLIIYDSDNGA